MAILYVNLIFFIDFRNKNLSLPGFRELFLFSNYSVYLLFLTIIIFLLILLMKFDRYFNHISLKFFPAIVLGFIFNCNIIFSQNLPPINLQYSSYAVTSDGHLIGFYGDKNRVDARSTGYISQYVIWSLIATEDRDFYNHNGVSIKGIIRGIFKTLTGHIQGGSTLTMQLARNLFLTDERTISRKIKEIELARQLEEKYTKDEILLMYLNTVYFGRGAYGIWAAAEEYFDKTPGQLSITESAALVGMVQSPGGYDPINHPGRMWTRRNIVLHNLVEINKLSEDEYEKLIKTPLGLNLNDKFGKFFLENVRKEANKILVEKGLNLNHDELKITTTLNYNMQKSAEDAVNSQWRNFPNSMKDAQIGLISVEPGTGMIRAMVGGNPNSDPGGLNRAVQILRQPGSSFKPFLYGSLLEKGYSLAEPLSDSPIVVDSGTSFEWRPQNDDNSFSSHPVPMEYAIQNSINLSAAYAITYLTSPDSVVAFAHRLGIQSDIPAVPSIALGTGEVSPVEMASSMAVFADEGLYAKPFSILKIEDKNGRVIYDKNGIDTSTVLDSASAYLTTTALESVVNGGTASSVRRYFKGTAAGKTGTTQNFTDAWFVGYNPKLSTAIWIGFDNPQRKLSGGFQYGGTACAPIWGRMMSEISGKISGFGWSEFKVPANVKNIEMCEDTGEPACRIGKPAKANCMHEKLYPVNVGKLNEIFNLHHPVEKEKYSIDHAF